MLRWSSTSYLEQFQDKHSITITLSTPACQCHHGWLGETQPSDLESFSSPYKPISESVLENPSELSRSIAELTVAMENSSLDNGSSLPRSVLKSSSARISDSTGAIPKVVSVDKPVALPRSQGPQPWPRANVEVENTLWGIKKMRR